ncbi:MAG: family 78 glycoside hydrolase catalytic domain, partial [Pseudolysinimonas sp.]
LRSALATDRFTLSGGNDVFEPTFTFHGFRYAEINGWTGSIAELQRAIRAVVIGSAMKRRGRFTTSHPLLNRFHENVVWGMRGNFVDVPTDCPQRDERLGWTGDLAVFAPTAAFLFDSHDFLTDWMLDLTAETEHANGIVPFVVPNMFALEAGAADNPVLGSPLPTAVWGDAAVWVPWALYQSDGDETRLARLYRAMALHGNAVAGVLADDGLWDRGFQFGDWLDPLAPPDDPGAARTPSTLVATASGYRSLDVLAQAAGILGHADDAVRWRRLAARVRSGFRTHFVVDGGLTVETETAYSLAIVFGLLDAHELCSAGERLAQLVRDNGHRIGTGFAGTAYVTEALSNTGHIDDAYGLLLQTECPSWLYPVTMGATTVWERWDSMLPDGSINPGEMTSFNHYALGSVADWMHRTVGGIAPLQAGYRKILIAPRPGPGLDWCDTSLELPSGPVRVRWRVLGETVSLKIDIGAPAVVRWPGSTDIELAPGHHELTLSR